MESRNRDEIRLSSQASIVNDKTAHPGLSAGRADPVVIGGSLYFTAAGSVGGYGQSDATGAAVNDALIVAAIGPQATLNATAGGDVALVQVAQADDAQGATQTLALNVGRIEARNVWLAARSSVAGVGGDIHVAAGSALSAVGVASLLAGNNLYVAAPSNGQPGGLISAGQRMNLRVDRDDRGAYGKASAITIDGRLLAPEIVIHGSETGANTVRFGATADAGGALDGNGLLTQGNTMRILGGSGQDDIEIRARLIAQQLLTVSTQDGDDRVVLQSTETSGGVRIETGAGDDTVSVIDTRVGGGLSILTGDGGNVVTLDTATVGGDTSITSGRTRTRSRWSTAVWSAV